MTSAIRSFFLSFFSVEWKKRKGKRKKSGKPDNHEPKEKDKVQKLPAKLLDYFLRSNKSNINQCHSIAGLSRW